MDNLFEANMALRCKIKALENKIEEFKSGARYLKLQKDHHRVIAGYVKEIGRLKKELADQKENGFNETEIDGMKGFIFMNRFGNYFKLN